MLELVRERWLDILLAIAGLVGFFVITLRMSRRAYFRGSRREWGIPFDRPPPETGISFDKPPPEDDG